MPFVNADFYLGPNVTLYSCKADGLVLRIYISRRLDHQDADAEVIKYRTAEGVGIGMDEGEVLRLLGRPAWTGEPWTERHGTSEVQVRELGYTGLRVRIDQGSRKVLAIGVETPNAWRACENAVRARPAAAMSGVPLPPDVRIVPPSATVPSALAAFSGRWVGVWDRSLDHVFIVEEVTPPGVAFIYAWGTNPGWNILRPGWVRARGQFVGEELQARLANMAFITYRRAPNDTIGATYELQGITARATLVRVPE